MSIADIAYSLSGIHFNAVAPKDVSYMVWNAKGSQATCDVNGFFLSLGVPGACLYSCSINLYYLFKIKFSKSDVYISKKVEPFLLGFPILYILMCLITRFIFKGFNVSGTGSCHSLTYNPPHCIGYNDGEIREGFEIPCGRGNSSDGVRIFNYVTRLFYLLAPLVIVTVSMLMIYRAVLVQERKIRRYGSGSTNVSSMRQSNNSGGEFEENERHSALSMISITLRRLASTSENNVNSRAVMHRALAYALSYLLSWIWPVIYAILDLLGAWPNLFTAPTWQVVFLYFWYVFNGLQGVFTLLVYIHPKVMSIKRSSVEHISWLGAFRQAFMLGLGVATTPANRGNNLAARPAPDEIMDPTPPPT
mmetsp:Transcript_13479/g.28596  ORF Transcript_13479/g.28596 Transcript_13479/m.28596 type:complete len:362 (+) Transcript_13479:1-1086(+)